MSAHAFRTISQGILQNVGTTISFKLGAEDAEYMAREFSPVSVEEVYRARSSYHILIRLKLGDATSHPFTANAILLPSRNLATGTYREMVASVLRAASPRS